MTTHDDTPAITDTRTYEGIRSRDLDAWLADTAHSWQGDELILYGLFIPEAPTWPKPGWLLVRWTDGEVTAASPRTAHRTYGPQGIAGRLRHAEEAIARVREASAQLMRAALNTAGEPLTARDEGIDTAVRRILTALDQNTEH